KRATPGTDEFKVFSKDHRSIRTSNPLAEHQHTLLEEIENVEARLRTADLRQMNSAFTRRRGRGAYDPEWYAVLFPRQKRPSLYTLAKQVGRRANYRLIYEHGSEIMHSSR